ncbi:MAG: reverse transcriptase family protein [Vallitaleaceae bacterium]|nr:reverse transcriptase family protein [Vallitaleaceae bacterium]
MNYKECSIYKITKKSDVNYLLDNADKATNINKYHQYITTYVVLDPNGKPKRLIECIEEKYRHTNKVLFNLLKSIETPEWHFSKKAVSYLDNAFYHLDNRYMLTLDIKKFFPNTSQDSVYRFFLNKFELTPDIASYLAKLCTVNIDLCKYDSVEMKNNVNTYMEIKKIRQRNHLITGASTSCLLSFLVHQEMFEEIRGLLKKHEKMSVYVDDITISSNCPIDKKLVKQISAILYRYGHRLSKNKTKYYTKDSYKRTTGVILTPSKQARIPNSKRNEIFSLFGIYKETGYTCEKTKDRLRGLLNYARSIEPNAFPRIYEAVVSQSKSYSKQNPTR